MNKTERPVLLLVEGRDALNLCEFPLAALGDRVARGQKTLVFEDSVNWSGKTTTRRLIVAASEKYGLPTALDDEVILGLIQLTKQRNFRDRTIPFTRYDLIQLLGWRDEGRSYRRIEEALRRWVSVTLVYEKAWWDKEEQSFVNESFHILENVTLYDRERRDRRRGQGLGGESSFTWNQVVFRSFQAGYLKKLNLEIYRSLKSSVAKRLYRFLDKRMYQRGRWEFDLRHLCCDKLGMSRNGHTGELKRILLSGLSELENVGIIYPRSFEKRFVKEKAGVWKVIIEEGEGKRMVRAATESSPLAKELVKRGIRIRTAEMLSRRHDEQTIRDRVAFHDYLLGRKDKRISRSAAGFLVQSIRHNYPLPPEFVHSKGASVGTAVKAPQRCDEAPPVTDDGGAAAFDEFWKTLPDDGRSKFERQAVEKAPSFLRRQYEATARAKGSLFEAVRQAILLRGFERSPAIPLKRPVARVAIEGKSSSVDGTNGT